jgi:hypothetical protein
MIVGVIFLNGRTMGGILILVTGQGKLPRRSEI